MDYKKKYTEAREHLLDYLQIEDNNLREDHDNLDLKELSDMLIGKYNDTSIMTHLLSIAFLGKLKHELINEYLEKATRIFNSMTAESEIHEDVFFSIIDELNTES